MSEVLPAAAGQVLKRSCGVGSCKILNRPRSATHHGGSLSSSSSEYLGHVWTISGLCPESRVLNKDWSFPVWHLEQQHRRRTPQPAFRSLCPGIVLAGYVQPAVIGMRLGHHPPDHGESRASILASCRVSRSQKLQAEVEAVKRPAMVIWRSPGLGKVMGRLGRGEENKAGVSPREHKPTASGCSGSAAPKLVEMMPNVDSVARHGQGHGVDASPTSDINNRRWWGAGPVPRAASVLPHQVLGTYRGFQEPCRLGQWLAAGDAQC
jgi:hypothetical protein